MITYIKFFCNWVLKFCSVDRRQWTLLICFMLFQIHAQAEILHLNDSQIETFYKETVEGNKYSWSDVEKLLENNDPRSVEDFLSLLPINLRTNYTLIHRSRSLQEASAENPRVLLFSSKGLVMSFNGDSKQRNYDKIEVLAPSDDGSQISMKEIDFSKGRPVVHHDPVSCTNCHRTDARPIWDSYAFWPGVFGSQDDNLLLNTEERKKIQDWLVSKELHPRYQKLVTPVYVGEKEKEFYSFAFSHFPYFSADASAFRLLGSKIKELGYAFELLRPNLRLTEILAQVQGQKLAHRILKSKNLANFSHLVSALIQGRCYSYPQSFNDLAETGYLERLKLDMNFRIARDGLEMVTSNRARGSGYPYNDKMFLENKQSVINENVRLQLISEALLISKDQLSLALEENSAQFAYSDSGLLDRIRKDPAIKKFTKEKLNAFNFFNCEETHAYVTELQKLNLKDISIEDIYPKTSKVQTSQNPFVSCMNCHSPGGQVGPYIPFESLDTMRIMLREPDKNAFAQQVLKRVFSYDDSRMPRVQILDQAAKEAIRKFIEN